MLIYNKNDCTHIYIYGSFYLAGCIESIQRDLILRSQISGPGPANRPAGKPANRPAGQPTSQLAPWPGPWGQG